MYYKVKKTIFIVMVFLFLFSCKSDDSPTEITVTYPTPELLANLSELNLFKGDLKDLTPTDVVSVYDL